MKRHPSSPTRSHPPKTWANPLVILTLAGIGQMFLSQWEKPYTLYPGLAFMVLAAFLFGSSLTPSDKKDPASQELAGEGWWFVGVMAIALFFRLKGIGTVPPGITVDASTDGLGGLAVLYEHWRPLFENGFTTHPGYLFYIAALWFKCLEPTLSSLLLLYVSLAVMAFPLIYWTFRQIAGPATALTALFILGVMRCDASFTHCGYPVNHVAVFIFGTLAFWLHGIRKGKAWAFGLSAFFFSMGFYTYHGYKLFALLMVLYFVYETLKDRRFPRRNALGLLLGALIFTAVGGPMILHLIGQGTIGAREMSVFIGREMLAQKSLMPLWNNVWETGFLFNRKGDPTPYHNFQSHRLLDDISGLFLVLGLAVAWFRRQGREGFYPLVGLAVMSLNCILTTNASEISRIITALPFVALLAGLGLQAWWSIGARKFPKGAWGVAGLLLLVMTAQNYYQYFFLQAHDNAYYRASDVAATDLGQRIAREGTQYDFCLSPRYAGHRTIHFLAYFHQTDYYKMDWPKDLVYARVTPGKKGLCFVLDEGKFGVVHFLESLYPQARVETLKDLEGKTLNTYIYVPLAQLEAAGRLAKIGKDPLGHGLRAEYFRTQDGHRVPVAAEWDPLVNFTYKTDYAFVGDPMEASWKGTLGITQAGTYEFLVLTESEDHVQLTLDGKDVLEGSLSPQGRMLLTRGSHRLTLELKVAEGYFSKVSLAWKVPGQDKFEIIPSQAFGRVKKP